MGGSATAFWYLRARLGIVVTRDAFSKYVPCEWSIIWCGSGGKHDAGIMYIEHWISVISHRCNDDVVGAVVESTPRWKQKSCGRTVARIGSNRSSWLNSRSSLIQGKYEWPHRLSMLICLYLPALKSVDYTFGYWEEHIILEHAATWATWKSDGTKSEFTIENTQIQVIFNWKSTLDALQNS